jgi:phospholipase C
MNRKRNMVGLPGDHSSRLARGELSDPAAAERLAAEDRDGYLRRRDFLARTAALAGGVSLASLLPADRLIAEAARRSRGTLPNPGKVPIDTFVVLMMENRSFDHYFGWHPDADSRNRGLSYVDGEGKRVKTHRLTPDFQGCDFRDPDHSWDGGRFQWNHGKMDGFAKGNKEGTGSDEFAAGYYAKHDIPFIPHAADAFTLYDRYFCSIMASTYPNRHYQWSAQSGGQKTNEIPAGELGNQWETIFDRARARGVSALYFASDLPFAALYGPRGIGWTRRIEEFYARAATGTLPNICFVDPPFKDGGGGDGTSADEHPHGDVRLGQAFMSDIVHAFMESPQYRRGALFVNYDEWGGFFEHVEPQFVPDARRSRKLYQDFGMTGFRVPGVVVSPFTRGGRVSHRTVAHESILKLISYRFGLGHLNRRHRYASNIGRTFNWDRPRREPPELPDPQAIVATPCSAGGSAEAGMRAKPHDLVRLESSGYLKRLGYDVPDATFDRIFREPDSVAKALRGSSR